MTYTDLLPDPEPYENNEAEDIEINWHKILWYKITDIRFFWVSDRLKQEKMSLEYCPTERMLGDFLKAKMTDFVLIQVTTVATLMRLHYIGM